MQDLYTESYKTLLSENKEKLHEWKDICLHGIEDNIKMSMFRKLTYKRNTFSMKNPAA